MLSSVRVTDRDPFLKIEKAKGVSATSWKPTAITSNAVTS